jgi:hypothetical protein
MAYNINNSIPNPHLWIKKTNRFSVLSVLRNDILDRTGDETPKAPIRIVAVNSAITEKTSNKTKKVDSSIIDYVPAPPVF